MSAIPIAGRPWLQDQRGMGHCPVHPGAACCHGQLQSAPAAGELVIAQHPPPISELRLELPAAGTRGHWGHFPCPGSGIGVAPGSRLLLGERIFFLTPAAQADQEQLASGQLCNHVLLRSSCCTVKLLHICTVKHLM